jgi:hypothetical protein
MSVNPIFMIMIFPIEKTVPHGLLYTPQTGIARHAALPASSCSQSSRICSGAKRCTAVPPASPRYCDLITSAEVRAPMRHKGVNAAAACKSNHGQTVCYGFHNRQGEAFYCGRDTKK